MSIRITIRLNTRIRIRIRIRIEWHKMFIRPLPLGPRWGRIVSYWGLLWHGLVESPAEGPRIDPMTAAAG